MIYAAVFRRARPRKTVDHWYASWAMDRSSLDPATMDWSVPSLTIQDWEYTSLTADYDSTYTVTASVYQEYARTEFTCPK